MAGVTWSRQALADLASIWTYIALDDPAAGARMLNRLREAGDGLVAFPRRGRPVGGAIRELATVTPYIVRYAIDGEQVSILSVRHGRQRPVRR